MSLGQGNRELLTGNRKRVLSDFTLVGCVRPNNLVKNRFPLSDAPYSIRQSNCVTNNRYFTNVKCQKPGMSDFCSNG
ncbi:MAG: hypothetical protein HEQ13_14675 [Dolichospermum sp. DEX189]|nr:hypothetical protein [Dolichospermum sp. DEX189]